MDSYDAVFPSLRCTEDVEYYVTVQDTNGVVFSDPVGVDVNIEPYTTTATVSVDVVFEDTFEADEGWVTLVLGATTGQWQRGVPVDDPNWPYDPATDGDGSGQCYLTQNELGDTDVDGGFVRLTSPILDMSSGDIMISYEYFLRMTADNGLDGLLVEIRNGVVNYTEIVRHITDGGLSWRHHDISPTQITDAGVTFTATMQIRFTATDGLPESIVEAGIDGFRLNQLACDVFGDLDGDGIVGIVDFLMLLGAWGPCSEPCPPFCVGDLDEDCNVGITDFLLLLANWS